MTRLIILLLFLFGVALENYGQRQMTINEYSRAEIEFVQQLEKKQPSISREQLRERLRQFYQDNFPKVLNETSNQSDEGNAKAMAVNQTFNVVPDSLERLALEALYMSTGGSNWTNNTNWLQGSTHTDFATWHGVIVINGDITMISLAGHNLKGPLPEEIGLLTNLEYLTLYNNDISGALPSGLGQLKKLINLSLINNDVTGLLPPEIGEMSSLSVLELGNNKLTGPIPVEIGKLSNLSSLNLSHNNMTGTLPKELGDLSSLQYLILAGNYFVGKLPSQIGNLHNLLTLSMSFTGLTGTIPPEIGNLNQLKLLSLQHNYLDGAIPPQIGQLDSLNYCILNNNNLTGPIPSEIGNLSKIEYLTLNNNRLNGAIPHSFGGLENAININLSYNRLSGAVPDEIRNLIHLTDIFLHYNRLTGFPDFSNVDHNSDMYVALSQNQITFEDLEPNFTPAGNPYFLNIDYDNQADVPLYIDYGTFTFSVEVGGANNRYQWYKNWVAIPGATQPNLQIAPEDFHTKNSFHCQITNTVATALTLKSSTEPVEMSTGVFYAVKDGSWHQSGTWSFSPNGQPVVSIPELDDVVYIQDHHITVNSPASCKSIEVIVEKNSASLMVDGALVTMYGGELKLTKKEEGYPANVRVVNGGQIKLNKPVEN